MHPADTAAPETLPPATSGFVITHCTTCAAGWTRKDAEGRLVVICLLDRLPAWSAMVACDRYEPREIADAPAG